MGELIALLFLAREIAHREHLKTKSFAQHIALGEFYPAIIDLADQIAEAYQGCEGKILSIPYLKSTSQGSIETILKAQLKWIGEHRKSVSDETAIQNLIDEVVAQYQSTLYKLKFLS